MSQACPCGSGSALDACCGHYHQGTAAPSAEHLMGTNNLGQDIFWLLSWSIRNSLWLGLSVAAFATMIGVLAGLLAGFLGGMGDRFLTLVMDVVIAFVFRARLGRS